MEETTPKASNLPDYTKKGSTCLHCRGRGYVLLDFSANFFVSCSNCGGTGYIFLKIEKEKK